MILDQGLGHPAKERISPAEAEKSKLGEIGGQLCEKRLARQEECRKGREPKREAEGQCAQALGEGRRGGEFC